MQAQARASYRGSDYANSTAPILTEYVKRKRLAKLGYTSDIGALECWKAEAFIVIDIELQECEQKDMKKAAKRGK